ncbi:MAG TPA: hypothetical protein VMD59_02465 [Acidimicrobiales bacterium]|nr:hypothetical protein [Acidimicrobiales bacterium]
MTEVTTIPSIWALLRDALRARRPVEVSYHGRRRLICPHALGWHNERPMLLGYQTGGETSTGTLDADPRKRWRCMYVDEVDQIVTADPASRWESADNYNPLRPFPAIDAVAVAIALDDQARSGD